jgi:parvulin-like peptidyl-prolyl isomerase
MIRAVVCVLVVACHPAPPARPPVVANVPPDAAPAPVVVADAPAPDAAPVADEDIDSKDILARETTTSPVLVKHVLVAWAALAPTYRGKLDPRAAARDNAAAAKLAREILAKLQADPKQIDALVAANGEDPGMASGEPYEVTTDTPFVPEFKKLALRLKLDEAGIVKTQFGYHVILRVPPPPPDPLESAAILARPEGKGPVQVQYILIGWKDTPQETHDPRSSRTKAEADKLAGSLLARAKRGDKMAALIKEFSEDPNAKDRDTPIEITSDTSLAEPFKKLALRLKLGEVGIAKTKFGWLVIKRVPPPPPDSLASTAILARAPVTASAKVKHILLGWKDRHAEDQRGKDRSRADVEKLVKVTVAKLKRGAAIEPLMAELSEDPGSASNGTSYDVTPDAGLVKPFKDLSLRLNVGEIGVVDTEFGIHIIQRVE